MSPQSIRRLLSVLVAAVLLSGSIGSSNVAAEDVARWRPEEGRELIGTPAAGRVR